MLLERQLGDMLLPPGERSSFAALDCTDRLIPSAHSARDLAASVHPGGLAVVVLRISTPHRLRRGVEWVTIPLRATLTEGRLRAVGLEPCGRFAVYPGLDNPTFVYAVGSAASAYAETHLLPPSSMSVDPWMRGARRYWPSPRVGAILIPARKHAS